MISAHITFLIGIYQWFAGAYGYHNISNIGMSAVMQNNAYRFFAIEHAVGMIIAIALITVARGVYRKNIPDGKKHIRCITFCICLRSYLFLHLFPWPGMRSNRKAFVKRFLV